jgi:chemotaxis protein methyltransferase WspC
VNLAPVVNLLRQRIGLEAESLGTTTLSRAVTARMEALELATSEAYAARLAIDTQEFQLLLANVTVPETWFFRGGEVFTYLARQVADVVRLRGSEKKFRILSVPCSTGEEPYSLAIALAEVGATPASWEIEAVDLNFEYLETARRARFGSFSFRETTPAVRDRYFQPIEGSWELDSTIRSRVRFRQGNLLDPLFLAGATSFDLILCRNLFIYLHADARGRVLDAIVRLLRADGRLCTGHADPIDFEDARFVRTGPASYFLYRQPEASSAGRGARSARREAHSAERTAQSAKREAQSASQPALGAPRSALDTTPLDTAPRGAQSASQPALSAPRSALHLLEQARQQADSGGLDDALASCQEQLTRFGPSADLYSLMGVVHQARGENDEAVRCYQRALYLEQEHAEALAHLMLLSQERGDAAQAERLRRRLDRAAPGGDA